MEKDKNLMIIEKYKNDLENIPGISKLVVIGSYSSNLFLELDEKFKNKKNKRTIKEKKLIETIIKMWFKIVFNIHQFETSFIKYENNINAYHINYKNYDINPNKNIIKEINNGEDIIKNIRKEIWLSKILKILNIKIHNQKIEYIKMLEQYFENNYDKYKKSLDLDILENKEQINSIKEYIKKNTRLFQESKNKDNVYVVLKRKTAQKIMDLIPEKYKNREISKLIWDLDVVYGDDETLLMKTKEKFPNKEIYLCYLIINGDNISIITKEQKTLMEFYSELDTTSIILIGNNAKSIKNTIYELTSYEKLHINYKNSLEL